MPYTHISHVPGHSLNDYQAIADGVAGNVADVGVRHRVLLLVVVVQGER